MTVQLCFLSIGVSARVRIIRTTTSSHTWGTYVLSRPTEHVAVGNDALAPAYAKRLRDSGVGDGALSRARRTINFDGAPTIKARFNRPASQEASRHVEISLDNGVDAVSAEAAVSCLRARLLGGRKGVVAGSRGWYRMNFRWPDPRFGFALRLISIGIAGFKLIFSVDAVAANRDSMVAVARASSREERERARGAPCAPSGLCGEERCIILFVTVYWHILELSWNYLWNETLESHLGRLEGDGLLKKKKKKKTKFFLSRTNLASGIARATASLSSRYRHEVIGPQKSGLLSRLWNRVKIIRRAVLIQSDIRLNIMTAL